MSKPELPHGYLGPQPKWEEMGLSTVTHNGSDFRCHDKRVEIKFKTMKPTKLTAMLVDVAKDQERKDLVFTQTLNELITLVVNFPSEGFYKLQCYAVPTTDEGTSLPNVFNYLIQCTVPCGEVSAFPKQFAQWKDGCYLFEPFSLKGLDSSNVKVIVPGAKAVALTVDNNWFPLTQRAPQKPGEVLRPWSAHVDGLLKYKGKKAAVAANFTEEDDTKYASLLEYQL